MATIAPTHDSQEPAPSDVRLVISASALGTVFEWYDFFIYGTLAASGVIGRTFFPAGNEMVQALLAWAGFAVGFGFRPLGAVVFGYLGDRLGRKYTFLDPDHARPRPLLAGPRRRSARRPRRRSGLVQGRRRTLADLLRPARRRKGRDHHPDPAGRPRPHA